MKKLKISMLALVFAVSVGGAVAEKVQAAPKVTDQIYSWTAPGRAPFTGTATQASSNYGCSSGTNVCATGTAPGVPNDVLHKP